MVAVWGGCKGGPEVEVAAPEPLLKGELPPLAPPPVEPSSVEGTVKVWGPKAGLSFT